MLRHIFQRQAEYMDYTFIIQKQKALSGTLHGRALRLEVKERSL